MIHIPIFQTIIDTIPNPIIITDGKKMVKANKFFLDFFVFNSLEDFINENSCICNLFLEDEEYFSLAKIDNDILWTDYIYQSKKENIVSILNKDKEHRNFELSINKLDNDTKQYVVVFSDITTMQSEKKLLKQLAYYDSLTQIYNRHIFKKLYEKEMENLRRYKDDLSLIMFDIDHFKNINDTYGHNVGDEVLVLLSNMITKNLRINDIFARWGGEEFMILLPRTSGDLAYEKAKRLRDTIDSYSQKGIPHFTVSFGVTQITAEDKEQMAFMRVDDALYKAKIKRNDVFKI